MQLIGAARSKIFTTDTAHKWARLRPLGKGQAFCVVFLGSSQETKIGIYRVNDSKTQYLASSCTIPVVVFIFVWR